MDEQQEQLSLWDQLPEDVQRRIVGFLPLNEVAGSFRLVDKTAARRYNGPQHTTVRLSQPVPHHAFQRRYGPDSRVWRTLSLWKRIKVLCLTAAAGDFDNLDLAVRSAGCLVTKEVLEAAAKAGHLHVFQWILLLLLQQDRRWNPAVMLKVARTAARRGHLDVVGYMQQQLPGEFLGFELPPELLAEGCDLATLQQLHLDWQREQEGQQQVLAQGGQGQAQEEQQLERINAYRSRFLAAAAGGCSPDWQAKVEWLEAQGCPKTADACARAAGRPDAVERLRWLGQRGYPLGATAVDEAARKGNVAALEYLLGEAGVQATQDAAEGAAKKGQLAALQVVHAHGCPLESPRILVLDAAQRGHLAVVAWLVETLRISAADLAAWGVFNEAALSGSMELLTWLHERGCRWDERTFSDAATGGCEEMLEWLVERGCPIPDSHPIYGPARFGDLATLRCLRRLGCPWGSTETFTRCAGPSISAPLPVMKWMLAQGCPVDWRQAVKAAWWRKAVAAWLREEWRRREPHAAEREGLAG